MVFNNSMDIFDEMDEMFERLLIGMHRKVSSGRPLYRDGYHIEIRGSDEEDEPAESFPRDSAAFKPAADVQRIGDEVKVVADLPGITADSLRLGVRNSLLVIDAGDGDYHYHTSAMLPPVDPVSMTYTLKNGVLEVTFRALSEKTQV